MKTETQCAPVPQFERLRYFYGQVLGAADFRAEQDYFREKLKLHNRCLHGYGVVCGLEVVPKPPPDDCESETLKSWSDLDAKRQDLEAKLTDLYQQLKQVQTKEEQRVVEEGIKACERELEAVRRELAQIRPCDDQRETRARVGVQCGLALDCEGNELVVRRELCVDLWTLLSPHDQRAVIEAGRDTVYLSLCYCDLPIDPVRPVQPEICAPTPSCVFSKLRDSVKVHVSVDPPEEDERCETCCTACGDPCLLLAKIEKFHPYREVEPDHIHNHVRRPLSKYVHTVVTGINWTHGAEYTVEEAAKLLGTDDEAGGLAIQFSRPVRASTLQPGVVEILITRGGAGPAASMYEMFGDIDAGGGSETDRLRYRQNTGETLQDKDRVLITLRCDFILDRCCRPVDGNHIGGRAPILPGFEEFARQPAEAADSKTAEAADSKTAEAYNPKPAEEEEIERRFVEEIPSEPAPECPSPPGGFVWTSGNGSPGGVFQSWFFIRRETK